MLKGLKSLTSTEQVKKVGWANSDRSYIYSGDSVYVIDWERCGEGQYHHGTGGMLCSEHTIIIGQNSCKHNYNFTPRVASRPHISLASFETRRMTSCYDTDRVQSDRYFSRWREPMSLWWKGNPCAPGSDASISVPGVDELWLCFLLKSLWRSCVTPESLSTCISPFNSPVSGGN